MLKDVLTALAKQMPKFVAFCIEIFLGMFRGRNLTGHALGHAYAGALEGSDFVGIIGEQAHALNIQRLQNFDWHEELALIGLEAEALIGLHRIESAVLQRVGLQLRHQSYAAALLLLVDQDAGSFLGDHGERHFQLLAAVAAQRAEDVAGQALRVNAHQWRSGMHFTHNQRHGFFGLAAVVRGRGAGGKSVNKKMTPARRKIRRSHLFYL